MIIYRIYAPYHQIVNACTIECGVYDTPEEATDRLVELFGVLGKLPGIETEWVSPDRFRARVTQGSVKSVIYFKIIKYVVGRKLFANTDLHPLQSVLSNN